MSKPSTHVSFARSFAIDAAQAVLLMLMVQGYGWAGNVLTFTTWAIGVFAIVGGLFLMLCPHEVLRKADAPPPTYSRARRIYERTATVVLTLAFASIGEFGLATVWLLGNVLAAAGVHNFRLAFQQPTQAPMTEAQA